MLEDHIKEYMLLTAIETYTEHRFVYHTSEELGPAYGIRTKWDKDNPIILIKIDVTYE